MTTYLCEMCRAKFSSVDNYIDKPCPNDCGYPLTPLISFLITGVEKEKESQYVDTSGLSLTDINQLKIHVPRILGK